ncbi:carbohydrate ABC transporter permease [Pseudarthrobacter defluvii]|uniref:carbohydrate ABC transporter permease n=1 Tax=Pseudarthrobacter defluvii TaxID=410837 RepID=UPI0025785206|nr:carbohydrate ABC transporter permease [Pseudarthrobacter defluvii]WJH24188.1 carbohydrate ABC transporter permease [Pseudarthrobacter defluvii]
MSIFSSNNSLTARSSLLRRQPGSGPQRPSWDEEPGAATKAGTAVVLAVVVLAVLGPLYTIVLTSFSSQATITQAGGLVLVPGEMSLSAYQQILSGGVVTRAVLVSIGVTATGTALSMVVSVLCAYGLSRPGSFAHTPILFTLLVTMFFSAGIIPAYLLVSGLGLINTYWALILPSCISVFNIIILRGFFMGMDRGILDSARIDGASEWRTLTQIVLPMSKAVTAVIALFYGVGYWNAFFNAVLYINDSSMNPLQVVLRSYVLQGVSVAGQVDVGSGAAAGPALQMAVIVLAMVPILIVYPFVQKHFTKGVMIGAVKG